VVQAAGTTFAVTAAQLATTTFTAGTAVSDGLFGLHPVWMTRA
jgi:hypothetical protein